MTAKRLSDPDTPMTEVLRAADLDGVLLETDGEKHYAVLPLDDDLIDYLIERNPKLIEECRQIRDRMRAGASHAHADVTKMLEQGSRKSP